MTGAPLFATPVVAPSSNASKIAEEAHKPHKAARFAMVLVVLGLGIWTFRGVALGPLWHDLIEASPGWIAAAALVNLAVIALRALRWLALVRPLSAQATFGQALESVVVGLAFSTILPARAGELVRTRMFSKSTGLPGALVLTTIGLDFLVNGAGLVFLLALLPLVMEIPSWIWPGALTVIAVFVAGVIVVFAFRPKAQDALSTPVGFLALARRGLGVVGDPRALALSLTICLVSWFLEIGMTGFSMRAVGLELPFSATCVVLLAVNLAVAMPLQPPGSFGTLEAGAILALVGMGVAKEQALAFGIVYHLLQVIPVGILGIVLWGRYQLRG